MSDTNNIIQTLRTNNTQLKKISELQTIDNINSDNKSLIYNSYILLTNPNVNNSKIKVNTIFDSITDEVDNKLLDNKEELLNIFDERIDDFYDKDDVDELINSKHQLIYNTLDELESEIENETVRVNNEYYNKDKINSLLYGLRLEFQNKENAINSKLDDINDELTDNTNERYNNSRLDKIEKGLQFIRNNIYIDNIDKIVWSNYNISGISEINPEYIINIGETKTFTINKGIVMAKYTDETDDQNITNEVDYIISSGQLNKDTGVVTLKYGNVTDGDKNITVKYKDHIGETNSGSLAEIKFHITKLKYNKYLWIVDSAHLNNIIDGGVFKTTAYQYACESNASTCPMQKNKIYNASNIIKSKFNIDNSLDISSFSLYIILPSEYISISNNKLTINGSRLKTNIFEIDIEGLESTFIINEQSTQSSQYSTQIEYSLIKISNTITNGVNLNI